MKMLQKKPNRVASFSSTRNPLCSSIDDAVICRVNKINEAVDEHGGTLPVNWPVHPTQISAWKKQARTQLPEVFKRVVAKSKRSNQTAIAPQHQI